MEKVEQEKFVGWKKCSACASMFHEVELDTFFKECPKCSFPFYLSPTERIAQLADEAFFEETFDEIGAKDLLGFEDSVSYKERLSRMEHKTGKRNAITTGICKMGGNKVALAVQDFTFMGGSLGRAEGERLTWMIEDATAKRLPVVIVCASGGARMQESMFSLMQMAKTSAALQKHKEANLFYLSLLTNPTMGGVSASYAFLGDIILAEKEALIGFAGPRVIAQMMGRKVSKGDQKAEFQLEHGMVDQVVARKEVKEKIVYFIKMFGGKDGASNYKR
ncbi:acetyl-CoA carboxylase carboxyl transferase subunit beta [bacterium]|nr:acetyl-CoA carboxylase carboxyl transferase subunit beta [bacterium]